MDNVTLELTKEEFEYLKGVLKSLFDVQSKIPKKLKTKNSDTLCNLYFKIGG